MSEQKAQAKLALLAALQRIEAQLVIDLGNALRTAEAEKLTDFRIILNRTLSLGLNGGTLKEFARYVAAFVPTGQKVGFAMPPAYTENVPEPKPGKVIPN